MPDLSRASVGALMPLSPERVNQQRDGDDGAVLDKVGQYNALTSVAAQSRQLERRTADAALRRAMLGREQAESDSRRFRDENAALRKQVDEGKQRERRVGERLETVMENFGRAKETHAHTQALWEKEIRRARKETFKTQSNNVRIQEELKSCRSALRLAEEALEREVDRSRVREQEAFAARCEIVGVQELLDQTLERVRTAEQERDTLRSLADSEQFACIAAEDLPSLPPPVESSSPPAVASLIPAVVVPLPRTPRPSLGPSAAEIVTASAAAEAEIEHLARLAAWEAHRANRALELAEFMRAECVHHCCQNAQAQQKDSALAQRLELVADDAAASSRHEDTQSPTSLLAVTADVQSSLEEEDDEPSRLTVFRAGSRRVSVLNSREGVLETASEEANASDGLEELVPVPQAKREPELEPRHFARSPSLDPPAFAVWAQDRSSLVSLLNAPFELPSSDRDITPRPPADVGLPPMTPCSQMFMFGDSSDSASIFTATPLESTPSPIISNGLHAATGFYAVTTTTTTVPLRGDDINSLFTSGLASVSPGPRFARPHHGHSAASKSLDGRESGALTPSVSREQALAQIHERRGRARSAAQAAGVTPQRPTAAGEAERRDVSAPAGSTLGDRMRRL